MPVGIALHHGQLLRRAYRLCSVSGGSCSYCALLDPTRLCISNEHCVLRAFEASSVSVIGAAACLASWFRTICLVVACSCQRSHTSSLGRSCCICASSVHELTIVLDIVLDVHSRAEWPVAPHVLHTRYGHEPIFWRCPDCAHSVQ